MPKNIARVTWNLILNVVLWWQTLVFYTQAKFWTKNETSLEVAGNCDTPGNIILGTLI